MTLDALITSLVTTVTITAAIGFVLRQSFEKVLENRLKKIEERNKADIQEELRRQSKLFDERFGALKTCVALVYKARNAARYMRDNPDRVPPLLERQGGWEYDPIRAIKSFHAAIEELLFEDRAVLPKEIFAVAHEFKHLILRYTSAWMHRPGDRYPEMTEDVKKEVDVLFARMDELYSTLVQLSEKFIESEIRS